MQTFKLTPKPQSDYRLEVKEIKKKCKIERHGYRHNKIVYGFSDKLPDMTELQSLGLNIEEITSCQDIPVIFTTGNAKPEDRQRYLDLGARDIIDKPYDPKDLSERLKCELG